MSNISCNSLWRQEVIIYWSDVDRIFIEEVPELPGCSAHGNSKAQALEQVDKAIELWIETAQNFGDPVPEPKGRKLMYA